MDINLAAPNGSIQMAESSRLSSISKMELQHLDELAYGGH
jgi:hypothetical protein